jgi:PAS domain S-box-containing protein
MNSSELRKQTLQSQRFEALYQLSQMDQGDLDAIKHFALEAAVQTTQSQIGYIYFMNEDETVLTLHAWSESVMPECLVVDPETEYLVAHTGLWGEAARQRKAIITNDYQAPNPHKKGLPEGHVAIQRHMNLPIIDQGRIVLIAGVGNKIDAYDDDDVRHLTLLMEGLWSILARARATAELRASEQHLRMVYEKSPASYQSLNKEGRLVDVNPAWLDTFGYTREEVIGRKFSEFLTESSQALVSDRFPVLKNQGKISNADFEIFHKNGHILTVTLNGRSSYDDLGEFHHSNCILTDVTEARRSETLLRHSEEKNRHLSMQFHSLLDSITDRIVMLDREMRIVWTNQKEISSRLHLNPGLDGCVCYGLLEGQAEPCEDCPAQRAFQSGQIEEFELCNPGDRSWLVRAFPVFNEQGEVIHVVEIGQDISDNIKLREEIGRTAKLASIGELSAGVAHEINNPINGVINYAQLIKNKTAPETSEHQLSERIIREGDRIAKIVKQLLFMARDDRTELAPVSLYDVLNETLMLVGTQFNNEGIDLEVKLLEDLPLISGSVQQLEQLFLNLLSNARYALNQRFPEDNPNKRIEIELQLEESAADALLCVRFYDRGTGIPADLLEKVLQPFITSKPSNEGTGLGLSISNDIVKKHGGSLDISSREGIDTEVLVRFPVAGCAS